MGDPQNIPMHRGGEEDPLWLIRRNASQTVASSFQLQSRDQFGGQVYTRSNTTLDDLSTNIGYNAIGSGNRSTAVGAFAYAREDDSVAVGVYAQGSGARAIAIGQQARAAHADSIAIGSLARTTAIGQVVLGSKTQTISEIYLGRGVTHTGAASTVEVHATDGTGTNVAGDHLALFPGGGTGSAAGGFVDIYRSSGGGASGSVLNGNVVCIRVANDGDVYYTGTGTMPTFGASFDDVGLLRIGPSAGAANSGVLFNSATNGNGNIGEVAVVTAGVASPFFAIASLKQGSAVNIPIVFFAGATGGGGAANGQMGVGDGVWVGDESTQSYIGQGTINVATGVYLNGTAYTNPDFVFEKAFRGKVEHFKNRKGADGYKKIRTLDEIKTYAEEHLHLPQLNDIGLRNAETGDDIFDRADGALLLIEELFLHLFELNDRLAKVEKP